jgi:hypothetical protein
MTSNVKSNKWVSFIKIWAEKNNVSYREAMRSEACKSAYKAPPEPERSPSPVRPPSPEPVEVETKPKKGRKKAEPLPDLLMPVPILVRSELEASVPLVPTIIKKIRVKREPKMVPT